MLGNAGMFVKYSKSTFIHVVPSFEMANLLKMLVNAQTLGWVRPPPGGFLMGIKHTLCTIQYTMWYASR